MCFLSDVIAKKVSACLTSIHKSILGKGKHNLYYNIGVLFLIFCSQFQLLPFFCMLIEELLPFHKVLERVLERNRKKKIKTQNDCGKN